MVRLLLKARRQAIQSLELVKGHDATSPIVMAITVETAHRDTPPQ